MNMTPKNVDLAEKDHFDDLAASWWDTQGDSRPLHELNPARLKFICERAQVSGAAVVDVGCGGGILSESLAGQGADVIGIDISSRALDVARLHLLESGLQVDYQESTAEEFARMNPDSAQIVTCLELLEHVPDPRSVVMACSSLLKEGGHAFFSTLNRTAAAFAMAIVGAEHVMKLIPRGTHRYDRFIRPSELSAWCRASGLEVKEICGLHYNPVSKTAKLGGNVLVNYLVHVQKMRLEQ